MNSKKHRWSSQASPADIPNSPHAQSQDVQPQNAPSPALETAESRLCDWIDQSLAELEQRYAAWITVESRRKYRRKQLPAKHGAES
jgi:hypothetical protein